ncbi:MAG: MucBP domain-containing protein, partial [Eubacterium sp.]|nr:MucBP domain-containing protein [Eubacterium sp.]
VNAMIEVYASDAPLLTDEEYQERISEFNSQIDELEQMINDEELLKDIENDVEAKSMYITYKDMVENRDKYYDIYLNQLETARTKYGFIDSSYGTVDTWMGAFENNPNSNISFEDGDTYESYRNKLEESWVDPIITDEEYEQAVAEFEEKYPSIVEEYMAAYEEAKEEYDRGEISKEDWPMITAAMEGLHDGTFYNTIMQYLKDCRDGYKPYASEYATKAICLIFSQLDYLNAYSGEYHFKFPDYIVQRNQQCSYIFDINIVATDALSVGGYLSLPSLYWHYEENCPSMYWVSEGFLKGHWEDYYTCNSRRSSLLNLGSTYHVNNSFMFSDDANNLENVLYRDKRYLAMDYIESEYGDSEYKNSVLYEYLDILMRDNVLKAIRTFTVECRDEYGNLIKSETIDTYDAYYSIVPEEIYDYQLVGPENIKGIINNEDTTVTFYYEHKDAEIKISYVDADGNELAPAKTISGKTLDEYTADPEEIPGYELISIPENASGLLHEDSSDVQFVYDFKNASVIVTYLDINGNVIADSDIISGKIFDDYTAEPKEIDGYKLLGSPNNASGKMTEKVINVYYIYMPLSN